MNTDEKMETLMNTDKEKDKKENTDKKKDEEKVSILFFLFEYGGCRS